MAKKEKDLNQVTSLGDNEYVRALTSSGESVQIKKSNLYPLVSEETHGLMSKGDKAAIGNKQLGSKQDYEKAVILLNSVDVNGNSYAYGILFRVRTQSATSALPVIYGTGYSGAGENIYKVSHILSLGISLKLCSCTYQGKRYMAIHDPEVSRATYILMSNNINGADQNSYKTIIYENKDGVVNTEIKNSLVDSASAPALYINGVIK